MKRLLLPSTAFVRSARRLTRKDPGLGEELRLALELLGEDAFSPQLRTHKLKGKLAGSWACSGVHAAAGRARQGALESFWAGARFCGLKAALRAGGTFPLQSSS